MSARKLQQYRNSPNNPAFISPNKCASTYPGKRFLVKGQQSRLCYFATFGSLGGFFPILKIFYLIGTTGRARIATRRESVQIKISSAMRVYCLLAGLVVLPTVCAAEDLFVGNFFGQDSDILLFNGTTGAFQSVFV